MLFRSGSLSFSNSFALSRNQIQFHAAVVAPIRRTSRALLSLPLAAVHARPLACHSRFLDRQLEAVLVHAMGFSDPGRDEFPIQYFFPLNLSVFVV